MLAAVLIVCIVPIPLRSLLRRRRLRSHRSGDSRVDALCDERSVIRAAERYKVTMKDGRDRGRADAKISFLLHSRFTRRTLPSLKIALGGGSLFFRLLIAPGLSDRTRTTTLTPSAHPSSAREGG